MSVTFNPIDSDEAPVGDLKHSETACLCAQGCPGWAMDAPEDLRPALREYADPTCFFCGGSGVEITSERALSLNLCNVNARVLLSLLGLSPDLYGSLPMPEARRSVMRARATFERRAPALVRETTSLKPKANFVVGGLDEEGIRIRLERFASLVEEGASRGAVGITWG